MDILSSNKVLQLEPLAPLIRQGERLADSPVFVLPKMRDGIDQTALAWEIRATSDHDTIVIQSLTADLTGTDIRLPWVVEGEFTAVAGALYITLCGKSATSDIVVKYVGSTALRVLAAEEGIYAPPPNIAEQTYQQRAAAEAAAASAGAALAETQSLKNQVQVIVAGNEAYTKSESNARFAGALVVKESGNHITVYPDATGAPITAVSLRGKTGTNGVGVGQFDKKVVFDGSADEAWAVYTSQGQTHTFAIDSLTNAVAFSVFSNAYKRKQTVGFSNFSDMEIQNGVTALVLHDERFTTVQELKSHLAAHPLMVYYQSTSYAAATQVYAGLSITDANGYHGYAAGPMSRLMDGDTLDFITGKVNRPLSNPTTETVPISEPITYTPGTLTIASENTVDVTYNKSLAKAFEQITAAIASLGTV